MRYLGIDYGTKLMGLSISDETNIVASPLCVIKYYNINEIIEKLKEIIREYNITNIVLGNPLNMNGTESIRTQEVKEFKKLLETEFTLSIALIDERLTSVVANNLLIEGNTRREKRKKVVDKISATLILQSFLDRSNYEK